MKTDCSPKAPMPDPRPPVPEPRVEEPAGVVCRHCGCRDLPVYYTRRRNGRIIRVRECRNCGRRMMTREEEV
ncbi:MAG: hypothetical protein BWZ02_03016 [Lentisphaerae bacterium ADurb.BinA184]|nr:MAG: hypothetical protein BWZ02_03016 [Lentisphaerae bacterium ADurb.BinA184]